MGIKEKMLEMITTVVQWEEKKEIGIDVILLIRSLQDGDFYALGIISMHRIRSCRRIRE